MKIGFWNDKQHPQVLFSHFKGLFMPAAGVSIA
jgi:hypothetical protein